ncbi:MAG: hypothetical protein B7Z36_05985 [Novosphingobium sp. 12-63-9]|nr:MAG: hypothetical protein B7Z36_05985 [Novosphingobium sp. 12-63-9]
MATLANTFVDLIDIARQREGDSIAAVIELLHAHNPILQDALAVECNSGNEHIHTIRTGLPSVSWGRLYKGTAQSKSTTQQVTDTTGFLEALSTIDKRLLDLYPANENRAQVRLNEAMAFMEAMNQEMATGMFYHDTATTPEKFKGLAARYSTSSGGGAGNQVVKAGGASTDNTSIWFVTWGERFTHLLYPKGSAAGIKRQDMGRQRVLDADSNPYYVEEEKFTWHMGVAVKDWRYNARIANIDLSDLAAGNVDIYKFMRQAYYKLKSRQMKRMGSDGTAGARQVIYCNRDILEALDAESTNNLGSDNFTRLRPMEIEGEEVLTYRGIPIRETEAILNTEALVP